MSPTRTMMRVRITTERHRRSQDSYYSRDYSYLDHAPSSSTASPRVIIDSQGTVHDPDFINNILSEQRDLLARRRASNQRAKRLSQQRGLIYGDHYYNSDSEEDEDDYYNTNMDEEEEDPFRGPTSPMTSRARPAQSYYVETPNMEARRVARAAAAQSGHRRSTLPVPSATTTTSSFSTGSSPTPRYILSSPVSSHASDMAVDESSSTSPASDKWSLKRWRRSSDDGSSRPKNTLKKREPEQPPFVFYEDEEENLTTEQPTKEKKKRQSEVDEDDTPSCGYALRRQWQSIVVRVTLSTYRAKRRLRPKTRNPEFNEKYGT